MASCQNSTPLPLALLRDVSCPLCCTFFTPMTVEASIADDTVIISLLHKDESEHGPVVDEFVKWCDDAFPQLNTTKTKDKFIDFRRNQGIYQ